MKTLLLALVVGCVSIGLAPTSADAKRIGGGGSAGMQRSMPARTAPEALPAKPATPAAAPATAGAAPAATAPKRSWMGPLAGLAAGLGIAALMSHMGLGAEFGNILMIVLLGLVAIVAIRFLMRRFGPAQPSMGAPAGMQFAGAGLPAQPEAAGGGFGPAALPGSAVLAETGATGPAPPLPADFDAAGFERVAKMIFIRMQAANDTADLNDLRAFTTPEMYATIRLDLQDRAGKAQQTDVVKIDAQVLDVASEADRQLVSVRFHGLIREDMNGVAMPFDEVWHLVKPADGSHEWAIAGIQQMA